MKKTLHNSDVSAARENVKDIKIVGNGDSFALPCKASSQNEGWMKSTKAYQIDGIGCLVQVTTQQMNQEGSYSLAEALTFVPGVIIVPDENSGRKLVSANDSLFDKLTASLDTFQQTLQQMQPPAQTGVPVVNNDGINNEGVESFKKSLEAFLAEFNLEKK